MQLEQNDSEYASTVASATDNIVDLSAIISGLAITYLGSKVLQIRQEKLSRLPELIELTKKINDIRRLCFLIAKDANFWRKKENSIIDTIYKGLSFYDVRHITYPDVETTELAKKFVDERKVSEVTGQLYLALKAFLYKSGDEGVNQDMALYSEFQDSRLVPFDVISKWFEYDPANFLWYTFEYKYSNYQDFFDFYSLERRSGDEILKLAKRIDKDRYQHHEVGPKLFSELGNQIREEFIPKLYFLQKQHDQKLPSIVTYIYWYLATILFFGVLVPITFKLFGLPIIAFIACIFIVLATTLSFLIIYYFVLRNELDIQEKF